MADKATLDSYQDLVASFTEFLTVAVHAILYERNIYPRTSFLNARKYNYPVRQSRHPQVCTWIQDAVAAVEKELLKGTVTTASLLIYTESSIPLERFTFAPILPHPNTFSSYPRPRPAAQAPTTIPASSPTTASSLPSSPRAASPPRSPPPPVPISLVDVHEQYRAILARLAPLPRTLLPIPPECTFTIVIEVEEGRDAPIGHPMPWIPVEGQRDVEAGARSDEDDDGGNDEDDDGVGKAKGGPAKKAKQSQPARTHPIRTLEAGLYTLECWVEESRGKRDYLRAWEAEVEEERAERAKMREAEREEQEEAMRERLLQVTKGKGREEMGMPGRRGGGGGGADATAGQGLGPSGAETPSFSLPSGSGPSGVS